MIYSRWRPDQGGYDYFETTERFGLGDDIPIPRLASSSAIGVSSVTAGRTPRGTLIPKGSGKEARGMVLATSRAGLSGLGLFGGQPTWVLVALGAIFGAVGYEAWRRYS